MASQTSTRRGNKMDRKYGHVNAKMCVSRRFSALRLDKIADETAVRAW